MGGLGVFSGSGGGVYGLGDGLQGGGLGDGVVNGSLSPQPGHSS